MPAAHPPEFRRRALDLVAQGNSGIVNDPNDWSREHEQPRYIIDLIGRIVTVSLETMKTVDGLPELGL